MRLFESIEQYLLIIGINSNQANQKNHLNVRNSTILLVFGIAIASDVSYAIYAAKTFQEYSISLYITSTLACTLICFAKFIWSMSDVFEVFNTIENIIDKSNLK